MKKLPIAYLGTPDFAADLLADLAQAPHLEIKFVVTQPDKPVGRRQVLTESPVKKISKKNNIPVYDELPENFNNVDLVFVYAYGKIIPAHFLHQPTYGFLNLHPSLLPKFRGPSPTAFPLILGEKKTGVSIMQIDEKVDHGPIVDSKEFLINSHIRRPELELKLTELGKALFIDLTRRIVEKNLPSPLPSRQQNDREVTYTRLLTKQDGFIPFEAFKHDSPLFHASEKLSHLSRKYEIPNTSSSPEIIYNLFRGLHPWPGIWTLLPGGKRLKITDMTLENGRIILKKVQLEGKNEVDFPTFQKAYPYF